MSRIILPKRHYDAHVHHGMEGRFKLDLYKSDADGNPIRETRRQIGYVRPVQNHLTNFGLNFFGNNQGNSSADRMYNTCRVGSGSTPPADSDTALESQIASTSTPIDGGSWDSTKYGFIRQIDTAPYYYTYWIGFQFNTGVAAGNLTEIGLFRGTGSPQSAVCRALITDEFGNPITLTVLSDEILQVTYELRVYIPMDDVTGTVTIKGTPYNFTMRPCSIGRTSDSYASGWPSNPSAEQMGLRAWMRTGFNSSGTLCAVRTAGTLLPMTGHPIDTSSVPIARGADSILVPDPPYVDGSFELFQRAQWGLAVGNHAAINMATLSNGFGSFQIYFDGDTFSKDATERMRFTLKTTWGRL